MVDLVEQVEFSQEEGLLEVVMEQTEHIAQVAIIQEMVVVVDQAVNR